MADHQNTVDFLFGQYGGETGQLKDFHYDSFGRPTDNLDRLVDPLNSLARHAGRPYEEQLDLFHNRARDYHPVAGRFIQEDPSGFSAGDMNLYRYCFNSPNNATDPSGQVVVSGTIILVATYLAWRAAESGVETYIESQIAGYMGDESFSGWNAFGRNMAVNTATGWIPGAVEGKIAFKAARLGAKIGGKAAYKAGYYGAKYGTEFAAETFVDAGYESLVNGRNFSDALTQAAIGNAIGHGVFRPVAKYAGRGLSSGGRWLGREMRRSGIIDPGRVNLPYLSRITTGLGMADPKAGRGGAPSRTVKELPVLDSRGKVHGQLPRPKDLGNYGPDDLRRLQEQLRKSVRERIRKTVELGRDRAHGQRQGAEQDLIEAIEKHLSGS